MFTLFHLQLRWFDPVRPERRGKEEAAAPPSPCPRKRRRRRTPDPSPSPPSPSPSARYSRSQIPFFLPVHCSIQPGRRDKEWRSRPPQRGCNQKQNKTNSPSPALLSTNLKNFCPLRRIVESLWQPWPPPHSGEGCSPPYPGSPKSTADRAPCHLLSPR